MRRTASLLAVVLAVACTRDQDATPTSTPPPPPTSTPTPTPTPPSTASVPFAVSSPSALTRVVAGVYRLVAPRPDAALDSTATLLSSALDAFVPARFGRLPAAPITVFVFSQQAGYERFCKTHYASSEKQTCLDSLGIYFHPRRELVVDLQRGRTTVLHELAHTLFEADFAAAPLWFDEGVSSLYEWPDFPADHPGDVHGKSNFRHQRLLDALRSPAERDSVRLDALFGMDDEAFRGEPSGEAERKRLESLHYSVARDVCRWLDARGLLWRVYAAWRDAVTVDMTGEAAFARVVGQTPKQANAEWLAWVTDKANDDRTPGRVP